LKIPFYEDVILAGFGGQGIMFIGKLLTYGSMKEGRNVTWIPSYGPEMRGGTANCTVVISDEEIGSPVITSPHSLIVMNNPSMDAFEPRLKDGGVLVVNSSLVTHKARRKDLTVVDVPANEAASKLGDKRVANMVMLGAYIAYTKTVSKEGILQGLANLLGEEKKQLFEVNKRALEKGMEYGTSRLLKD
jgi:2-oxoglutarate ferredoxin oxidoreductase subunit gamma